MGTPIHQKHYNQFNVGKTLASLTREDFLPEYDKKNEIPPRAE